MTLTQVGDADARMHGCTGTNKFRRHPSLVHNDLFPEVKLTRMQEYFAQTVGQKAMSEGGQ